MTAIAAASILFLAGCDSAVPSSPGAAAGPAGAASESASAAAVPDRGLGAAGSACELPVSFDIVEGWQPKAIDPDEIDDPLLASMFRTGPFETICSVAGKPAGVDGFVRVFFSEVGAGSPRDSLKVFVHADTVGVRGKVEYEVRNAEYSDLTVGGQPAAEVTWNRQSKSKKQANKSTALALDTPKGAVVVVLAPFTAGDFADVLPAYELAKKTLVVNR